jgi:glycosyltransferase involved in cell wall biosynthesis
LACFHGSLGNFGDCHSPIKRWLYRAGVRDLVKKRVALVAVSRRSAVECAAMYGRLTADFRVAYNGTRIPQAAGGELRRKPHRPFRVGFVGTVIATKGWQRVVAAVGQLRQAGMDVACSIVGDGPESAKLKRLAAQHAEWLDAPGHVEKPQERVFPALDALVLPSNFEGHPEVLLEAMACGVPCICADVGGCAETIRHDREGYLLRENSAEEIAAYLKTIVASEPLWARLSRNALARHREAFTAQHMANRWEQLYRDGSRP